MYEVEAGSVLQSFGTANPEVFNPATLQLIQTLTTGPNDPGISMETLLPSPTGQITVPAGLEVAFLQTSLTNPTTVVGGSSGGVTIIQGGGNVTLTFGASSDAKQSVNAAADTQNHADRLVVTSSGKTSVVFGDSKNNSVVLGTGDSTVRAGGGVDTVQAGMGNSTIIGGTGDYDVVKLAGSASNYSVTVANGHAVVTNNTTHTTTDITKVQFVQLDSGDALVFAKDSIEAQVAMLYHTALGRDGDVAGLDYWLDLAKGGATIKEITERFIDSAEFLGQTQSKTDTAFVTGLYHQTFNRSGDDAGVNFWVDALAHGTTRADLVQIFAGVAAENLSGAMHTEANVTGHVTVVNNIV